MTDGHDILFLPDALLRRGSVQRAAVHVTGGRVAEINQAEELKRKFPAAHIESLPEMVLVPGPVNAHSHSFQSLLRGMADDLPFATWRSYLYRLTPDLGPEEVYAAALFAFGEMLLRGVTSVCDFFYLNHGTNERALAAIRAANDLGIRLVLARAMMDSPDLPEAFRETPTQAAANTRALARDVQGHELVRVIPAPHSPHAASAEMIVAGARLASELVVPWHIHVAEAKYERELTLARSGAAPLLWLKHLGVLDERIRVVHGVWLDNEEISALASSGGGLIHCPASNLMLRDGIAPLRRFADAGIPVALGCDSGSANNHLSVFAEMRLASLAQRAVLTPYAFVNAREAIGMGTLGGAFALGLDVGAIEPGRYADFVALDLRDFSLLPAHDIVHNIVYSMESTAVRNVYVGGEAVVRNGRLVRQREETIAKRIVDITSKWSMRHTERAI